jgi:MATE family multidrug resistance protein
MFSSFQAELRKTISLALPMMFGQAGQMLMVLTDTLVVGRLGAVPLAAVALASSLINILFVFGLGLLASTSILGSQAHGAGDRTRHQSLLASCLWLSMGAGLFLALITYGAGPLLSHLGSPNSVLDACRPFLRILAWSLVPALGYTAVRSFCESMGHPSVPMVILYVAVIINLLLNVLLVFGLFGLPKLGLEGSACATFLSRTFALVITVWYALRISGLQASQLSPTLADSGLVKSLLKMGLPIGLQYLAEVGAFSFAAIMMGWLGASTLAAHQIAITCAATTFMFPLGLSQAITVRVGHVIGAGRSSLVRQIGNGGLLAASAVMGVAALFFCFRNRWIAELFSTDHEVVSIASGLVLIAGVFQLADGLQVTATGALRGLADIRIPMWIAFGCYWGVAIPFAYICSFIFGLGGPGVWFGFALGLFTAAAVFIVRFLHLSGAEKLRNCV